jgi:hypothetical protein
MKKKTAAVLLVIFIIIAGAAVGTIFFLNQSLPSPMVTPGITIGVN